jgi:deazaflavin-dependent oxidoreductase (nitroreductase family)
MAQQRSAGGGHGPGVLRAAASSPRGIASGVGGSLASNSCSSDIAPREHFTAVLDPTLAAASVCDLETIGRVTGLPRLVELWFAADGDRVYFLSGGRDRSDWVRNLAADGAVRVRIRGTWFAGTGRWIEGEADDPRARRLLDAKYHGWRDGQRLTQWATESLPVRVDLVAGEAATG